MSLEYHRSVTIFFPQICYSCKFKSLVGYVRTVTVLPHSPVRGGGSWRGLSHPQWMENASTICFFLLSTHTLPPRQPLSLSPTSPNVAFTSVRRINPLSHHRGFFLLCPTSRCYCRDLLFFSGRPENWILRNDHTKSVHAVRTSNGRAWKGDSIN